MTGSRPLAARSRTLIVAVLAAVVGLGVGPLAHPGEVAAGTAETMETQILGWINAERASRGLVPLRLHPGLVTLAGDRADSMASIGAMQHITCMSCTLNARGIQYYGAGEVIATNNYPYGDWSAEIVFQGWMNSSSHRAILMSSNFNYIGIGIAYRSANRATYASAVVTESKDRTKPWAKPGTVSRSGTTVSWTWTGADTKLQTRTAGLKNFDVQYRVDSGSWTTIRSGTTAKWLSLSGRAHGHWYGVRVRARDNLGYLSSYTAELRIWVP